MAETRLLSLGLDGAAWHKIDRLIEADRLPNFERLVASGTRAPLRSVQPPVTCPAWRCSTSGKNPGKVGVYWWLNLDRETGGFQTPDARSFDTADVWDYLADSGHQCAVVNVPMTYPPTDTSGLMVSGFGAPFDVDRTGPITHPPEAMDRLDGYDWRVGVDDVTAPGGAAEALSVIESRLELMLDLIEEGYDYVQVVVFYLNVLQHHYGDSPETTRAYELVDQYLGELPPDLTTVLYSDHGHSHIDRTLVVNRYLIDNGYLTIDSQVGDSVTGGLYRLLQGTGLSPRRAVSLARRVLPDSAVDAVVESGYPVPTFKLAGRVDWDVSTAVAVSQGPLYISRDAPGAEYETVRDQLREELLGLTVDGEAPLAAVHRAEEIYHGPHVEDAPDLTLIPADEWEVYGGVTPSLVEAQPTSWTSGNHPEGMVLFNGPEIEHKRLDEQSILDVMPTILRYMDAAVPTDIDGTAIEAPFGGSLPTPGSREPLLPVESGDSNETEQMEQRLADLGYLE